MLQRAIRRLCQSIDGEKGATTVEYVVIGAVMAALVIAGVEVLGNGLGTTFNAIADLVTGANGSP